MWRSAAKSFFTTSVPKSHIQISIVWYSPMIRGYLSHSWAPRSAVLAHDTKIWDLDTPGLVFLTLSLEALFNQVQKSWDTYKVTLTHHKPNTETPTPVSVRGCCVGTGKRVNHDHWRKSIREERHRLFLLGYEPNGGTPCRGILADLAKLGLASTLKSA